MQFRASLENDIAAFTEVRPDLAIGTTPVVQKAKEQGTPAIYFTNIVSGRPLFGIPGVAAMASMVAAQTRGRERYARMVSFFAAAQASKPGAQKSGARKQPAAEFVAPPVEAPVGV